jgi:hypothetical protein
VFFVRIRSPAEAREVAAMGHVRLSEHINAPIDHVWEILASCERLPEWNSNIVEVKDCPDRLDRVGAQATTVVRVFGRKIEGTQETTRADKPYAYALKLAGAGRVLIDACALEVSCQPLATVVLAAVNLIVLLAVRRGREAG